MTTDQLKQEAQAALDELTGEGRLPFKLEARTLSSKGSEHTIRFHDSRFHSMTVTCEEGQSFKEAVRAAILDRLSRLKRPHTAGKMS